MRNVPMIRNDGATEKCADTQQAAPFVTNGVHYIPSTEIRIGRGVSAQGENILVLMCHRDVGLSQTLAVEDARSVAAALVREADVIEAAAKAQADAVLARAARGAK